MKQKPVAIFKCVGYAYPSSPDATKWDHGSTGCWYLETLDAQSQRVAVLAVFDTKAAAFAAADLVELPLSRWSQKRDPS